MRISDLLSDPGCEEQGAAHKTPKGFALPVSWPALSPVSLLGGSVSGIDLDWLRATPVGNGL